MITIVVNNATWHDLFIARNNIYTSVKGLSEITIKYRAAEPAAILLNKDTKSRP